MRSSSRLCLTLIATLAAGDALGSPLLAAVEPSVIIDPAIGGPTPTEPGQWRTKVQQVFDAATRTLSRRIYQIWDPEPSRDLDFVWTPDHPAADKPGRSNGSGHLIWRLKGNPAYDRSAIRAE